MRSQRRITLGEAERAYAARLAWARAKGKVLCMWCQAEIDDDGHASCADCATRTVPLEELRLLEEFR